MDILTKFPPRQHISQAMRFDRNDAFLLPGFRRNSKATVWNQFGQLVEVEPNVPRIQFDPVTGECLGWLREDRAMNLLRMSERFNSSPWGPTDTTITDETFINPDGSTVAQKIDFNSTTSRVQQNVSFGSGVLTYSVFVYPISIGVVRLTASIDGNLLSFNRLLVPNKWNRIIATFTAVNSLSLVQIRASAGYNVDISYGEAYIWGAQLETGDKATSYIKTTNAVVTREADEYPVDASEWTSKDFTGGTFVVNYEPKVRDNDRHIQFIDDMPTSMIGKEMALDSVIEPGETLRSGIYYPKKLSEENKEILSLNKEVRLFDKAPLYLSAATLSAIELESMVNADGGTAEARAAAIEALRPHYATKTFEGLSFVSPFTAFKQGAMYALTRKSDTEQFNLTPVPFTRNGKKVRLNSQGILEELDNNVPSIEYNPDGSHRGYLPESAVTNLLQWGNDMSNGYYVKEGLTVTPTTDQDFKNADGSFLPVNLIQDDNSNGAHLIARNGNVLPEGSVNRIVSVIIKPLQNLRYVGLTTTGINPNAGSVTAERPSILVDLQTKTIINGQGAILTELKSGVFHLFGFSSTPAGSGNDDRRWKLMFSDAPMGNLQSSADYQGTSSKSAIVAFPQLSPNHPNKPSSPILSIGASSITRNPDILTYTNAQDYIGQSEGVLFANIHIGKNIVPGDTGTILGCYQGNSQNNRAVILISSIGDIAFVLTKNGSSAVARNNIIPTVSGSYGIMCRYKTDSNVVSININGQNFTASTNVNPFAGLINTIQIGNRETSLGQFNNPIPAIRIWKKAGWATDNKVNEFQNYNP